MAPSGKSDATGAKPVMTPTPKVKAPPATLRPAKAGTPAKASASPASAGAGTPCNPQETGSFWAKPKDDTPRSASSDETATNTTPEGRAMGIASRFAKHFQTFQESFAKAQEEEESRRQTAHRLIFGGRSPYDLPPSPRLSAEGQNAMMSGDVRTPAVAINRQRAVLVPPPRPDRMQPLQPDQMPPPRPGQIPPPRSDPMLPLLRDSKLDMRQNLAALETSEIRKMTNH